MDLHETSLLLKIITFGSLKPTVTSLENTKMNDKLPDSDRRKGHDIILTVIHVLPPFS